MIDRKVVKVVDINKDKETEIESNKFVVSAKKERHRNTKYIKIERKRVMIKNEDRKIERDSCRTKETMNE